MFHTYKDDVFKARLVLESTKMPRPLHVHIKKVRIPRKEDILLDGMKPEETKGTIKCEWLNNGPNSTADPRVILYIHGGSYIMMNRKVSG